jgi:hypothetical protein
MQTKRSRVVILMSTALLFVAFTVASCTTSQPTTSTPMAKVTNPCATKATMTKPATPMQMAKNPCNPCAAKAANPCNPCAAKNPCAAGSTVDPQLVTRPAGTKLFEGSNAELAKLGKQLWQDRSLGTSGLACQTCHLNHASFNPTFVQPYPHKVAMPLQRAGLPQVHLDEMVQFCMMVPMASKPLPWRSKELAALTTYAQEVQKEFIKTVAANPGMLNPKAANPCNPCAAKNPCNPCAAKTANPCAAKNPCNPCAAKMQQNPCNPCAAKNPCAKKW